MLFMSALDADPANRTGWRRRNGRDLARGMSLSVSITGLLTGLSLIVANGGQNVSRLTSAVTTLRTSGVRDVNDLSRSNH